MWHRRRIFFVRKQIISIFGRLTIIECHEDHGISEKIHETSTIMD